MPLIPKAFIGSAAALLLGLTAAAAADYFMLPAATGDGSGTDWSNALAGTRTVMENTINTVMQPGDTLYMGSGNYGDLRWTVNSSGTPTARKSIIGYDTGGGIPYMKGTQTQISYTGIHIIADASYWTIKNLYLERREWGVRAVGPNNDGLIIDNVTVRDTKERGFVFTDSDDLLVENCKALRYRSRGFFVAFQNDNVILRNCLADCSDSGDLDDITYWQGLEDPTGFDFHQKERDDMAHNTNILVENCVSRNNREMSGDSYEQGDGFKVERRNIGVTLRGCRSYRNRDANYDLKGDDQLIENCFAGAGVAFAPVAPSTEPFKPRYGFKVWFDGELRNCVAVDNRVQMIIAATSNPYFIDVKNSTFYCSNSDQIGIRIEAAGNTCRVSDSILAYAGSGNKWTNSGQTGTIFQLTNTEKLNNTANTANSPRFHNPVVPWNGEGDDFDNDTFGASKGYNSAVVYFGEVISYNLSDTANTLAPTDRVGVLPMTNWNNSTANNQQLTNVVNDSGTATTADIRSANTQYGYNNDTGALAAPMTDDAKMMRSQRALYTNTVMAVTAEQVPYASYDVYVYWGGRTSIETSGVTMEVQFQQLSGSTYVTTATKFLRDDDHLWDGDYDESTATTAGAAVDGQEYVVFRGVTTPEFKLRAVSGTRTGISGIQIVEN
jgi:hypothetical protein